MTVAAVRGRRGGGLSDGTPDDDAAALIARVGRRVRAARHQAGVPRRALSDRSGVSTRYLAQIEAGEGNVSLGILVRIAAALDLPFEVLLQDEGPEGAEAAHVATLYRDADPGTRARVMQALDPGRLRAQKAERICLVGLRGAGKSTLGRRLGETLGIPFVELTTRVEASAGIPAAEIIALYGQEGYRQLEAEAVSDVVEGCTRVILAVPGGVVSAPATFGQVLARFHTVWLKANPGDHMDRVRAQGDTRPMAGNPRAMIQLRDLLRAREARYAQADHRLDTSGVDVDASHDALCALVRSNGILAAPKD